MLRLRFTVRRLMVAVAVAAMMLGLVRWANRRRREAEASLMYHRTNAAIHRFSLEAEPLVWLPTPPPSPADRAAMRRLAEYHEAMLLKYEHAARYPWLPVTPDPPEPRRGAARESPPGRTGGHRDHAEGAEADPYTTPTGGLKTG